MITDVNIVNTQVLSDNWYVLRKVTYAYLKNNGTRVTQTREVYDRGNGAAILLYNTIQKTVLLARQFRLPTFLNDNENGMLVEVCAGLLDKDTPEECVKREAMEELGYKITNVKKVFEAYMSPGAVTELLHFFVAEYTSAMKVTEGGGLEAEEENIEVLELAFDAVFNMIATGEIRDAKTIMLLQYAKLNGLIN
ncbi:MAG: GDP-mannose pyrophosphatase NudK [Flavipsychrobacter sp.]|nr:GDP-mannose pyrophosphatase NudK [Flavipsychrobacter sp.]